MVFLICVLWCSQNWAIILKMINFFSIQKSVTFLSYVIQVTLAPGKSTPTCLLNEQMNR